MELSTRVGAAALASFVALGSVANAQGFYYQDHDVCAAKFSHQYLGCATVLDDDGPFVFEPTNWNPSITADNSRSHINYNVGNFVNNTISPNFCAQTCRAHGFKYAALFKGSACRCGNTLDYTTIAGVDVTLSDKIHATSEEQCTTNRNGSPPDPCPGDRRENCGSDQGARIFADPSFPDVTTSVNLAQSYHLLGCFKGAKFPSAVSYTTVTAPSAGTCLAYCAGLGMPYAFMIRQTVGVECHCGSEFNQDMAQASSSEGCTSTCSSLTDTAPCTGQDCCAIGGGPAPVYANVNFMGCFVPVIPGMTDPETDYPAPNGYKCFETPASILNRPTSVVANYNTRTISASASFVATASPHAIARPFVNFGCWQSKQLSEIFDSFAESTLDSADVNVENCVAFCDATGQKFAALYGKAPDSQCACANSLKANVDTTDVMQDCNQPCGGSATQNCGGDNGPLIYARNDVTPNKWAARWASSRSLTIRYSCDGGATPSSIPASGAPAYSTYASSTPARTPASSHASSRASYPTSAPTSTPTSSPTSSPASYSTSTRSGSSASPPHSNYTRSSIIPSDPESTTTLILNTPASGGETYPTAAGSRNHSASDTIGHIGNHTGGVLPGGTGPRVPDITDLPPETYIILQVVPHTPKKKHGVWNVRRQSVGGFVGGPGHRNPKTCDEASLFGVRSGQLLSGGQPIATNPGVAFTTFKAMPAGTITRLFTIIKGYLHWFNEQFTGGEAEFCQVPDGTVYIMFHGDNSGPPSCQRVDIVTYFAGQCVDGQIISGPISSGVPTGGKGGTRTGPGRPTDAGGPGPDVAVPDKDWIFRKGHAPDDNPCYETMLPVRDEL